MGPAVAVVADSIVVATTVVAVAIQSASGLSIVIVCGANLGHLRLRILIAVVASHSCLARSALVVTSAEKA
jgi:hypothetical protein